MFCLQIREDLEGMLPKSINEPNLVIYCDDDIIKQIFVCAEHEVTYEVTKLTDSLVLLMAMYYVFDVSYNPATRATLLFLQDILMECPDSDPRPTRYSTFVNTLF